MIVDVHAHAMPQDYIDLLGPDGGGSLAGKLRGQAEKTTLSERAAMMRDAGVGRQILSPTASPYARDPAMAVRAARYINDYHARLRDAHPDLFGFWAALPLPHVDEAIEEAERAFEDLGADGVVLGCFCLDQSIADERFDRLYAHLESRGSLIFLHPCQNGIGSDAVNDWGLTVCAGASLEDSLAAMHLIARGIPARHPRLRFIVPHFGGILPTLLARLDGQMPNAKNLAEPPSATAQGFYYDTVGWGSRAALLAAVEAFGASQLVTGSDYPVLLSHETYRQTFDHIRDSGLAPDQIELILGNAERILAERR